MTDSLDTSPVPVIDLSGWRTSEAEAESVARQIDAALRGSGFMLLTGHGVDPELTSRTRERARAFFALPRAVKARYAAAVDGRGWLPPGVEANGFSEGTQTPPDLKESLSFGADAPTGNAGVDARWFQQNPWPEEVEGLAETLREYIAVMNALARDLMTLAARALTLAPGWFEPYLSHPTYTLNINWYPPMSIVGSPAPGQFRIGPHTDFGTLTLLDRQQGAGGLQVFTQAHGWVDAPFVEGALTINVGDLLSRWTGDRWISARHRVLPPQESQPDEDLVSLVFFYEADVDALIESMPAPIGVRPYPPVPAGAYLDAQYQAISVAPEGTSQT